MSAQLECGEGDQGEGEADDPKSHDDPRLRSDAYYYFYFFERGGDTLRILQPSVQGRRHQIARAGAEGIEIIDKHFEGLYSTVEYYILGPPERVLAETSG